MLAEPAAGELLARDHAAGQHQGPGRSVDQDRLAVADMGLPIGLAELVADQAIGGAGVGNPQQRLGQHSSATPSWVDSWYSCRNFSTPPPARGARPHAGDQRTGPRGDPVARGVIKCDRAEQTLDDRSLVGAIGGGDRRAQRPLSAVPARAFHGARITDLPQRRLTSRNATGGILASASRTRILGGTDHASEPGAGNLGQGRHGRERLVRDPERLRRRADGPYGLGLVGRRHAARRGRTTRRWCRCCRASRPPR